ncbi:MAG: RMD1 family protein [Sulfuricaulis sp.]|nr:RMD1 family protein [Sulfuricaulis sp.]
MSPKTNDLGERLPANKPIPVRACFLGERLHLRGLPEPAVTLGPLTLSVGEAGLAVLFRYGAVVFFNLAEADQKNFLKELRGRLESPLRKMETEDAQLYVVGKQPEGVTPEGIGVADLAQARLQIVATALARSVALAYYENAMAGAFDRIEPLARRLESPRGGGRRLRELLRHIGGTLLVLHRMTGRVEIQDKPDLLWDHPEVERLYLHLENEYELRERNTVLERKLALIHQTAETAVNLMQNRSMLRVEWYIVILFVFEVLLSTYQLWFRH